MSFKDEMNDLAVELIEQDSDFKSISVTVTHRKPGLQSYDEETGEVYNYNSEWRIVGIIGPFNDTQNNAQDVQIGDLQLITACKTAPALFEPQNDKIILSNNSLYSVLSVQTDASESVYILQLRKG